MSSQVSVEDSPEMKSSVTHKLFRLSGPREPTSTKCLEYLRTRGVFAFSGHMQQVECCAHVNHVQHGVASPGKVESVFIWQRSLVASRLVSIVLACCATVQFTTSTQDF